MTFFFLVVGLEARRELDLGDLRERRRVTLPVLAGLVGMAVPVLLYLAVSAGHGTAQGWGAVMSTDTAFAIGMLTLLGPRSSERLRSFLLTVVIVDDLAALLVISVAYTESLQVRALLVALAIFAVILALRAASFRSGAGYALLAIATWVALLKSGVDPIVVGLAMGLLTYAYPASRTDLERATDLFRLFREQPTSELARSAREGLASALSPNERLQDMFHPWTSYVIVPLFALCNAGVAINGESLSRAFTSPVTLGIVLGYVVGKPLGIVGTSFLVTRLSRGRLRPPVGWGAVTGVGTVAGIGFTVALLISTLAFHGARLEEAKIGVLSAVLLASAVTWLVFRVIGRMPTKRRVRALVGTAQTLVDLAVPVDESDHQRGPADAPVTLVEYGDFECPYCGQAEPSVRALLAELGDLQYVWRHLPLTEVHPNAQLAAEAAEAAAEQGAFWEMHDLLLDHQDLLRPTDLVEHARSLGLDTDRFHSALRRHNGAAHVAADVESADLSGVSGTPTFFVNGQRHYGAYDIESLKAAVKLARARAAIADADRADA
jgi:Na+/H+ antiporter NhaA